MQSNNKKKICLVVSSLGKGGAEKSSALLSIMLDNLGYDVHIISVLNNIEYNYAGTLLNLGELKDKNNSAFSRLNRFKVFTKHLKTEKFDLIIDSRSRPTSLKELQISKFIYKKFEVIYIVHSYNLKTYFSKSQRLSRYIYKDAFKLVAVSNDIKNEIEKQYQLTNVQTIYNAVDFDLNEKLAVEKTTIKYDFILFYGRLNDEIKNISLLIEAFKNSKLSSENIKLIILGSGRDEVKLKTKVRFENLDSSIEFIPFTNNPFPYIKQAKFTLLTSRYEGFPMVIPESLSLNTPVISVDCKSGPREILKNEFNGLLVENNNSRALANAMNRFIFDEALYLKCRQNAKISIEHLSLKNIGKKWADLLNSK